MQQPALRLALLTFATLLVSGCAEQFAVPLFQTAWSIAPVDMPQAEGARSGTASKAARPSKPESFKPLRLANNFPRNMSPSAIWWVRDLDDFQVPGDQYTAWTEAFPNRDQSNRERRASDYLRERVA